MTALIELCDEASTRRAQLAPFDVRTFDVARPIAYGAGFYRTVVPALLRPHRLRRAEPRSYRARFVPTLAQRAAWAGLFEVDAAAHVPFTLANSSATMLLMRVLEDHGVNFRFVRHLRTELDCPAAAFRPGAGYTVAAHVADIIPLRSDRVAIVTVTATLDPDRREVASQRDFWSIAGVRPEDVAAAATGSARTRIAELQGLKRQKARLMAAPATLIAVPNDMGRRYGRVSGDLNPTHLSDVAARVFGNPRAFVQGFCTANLVIAAAHRLQRETTSLSVTFVRPIFVGQTVRLRHDDARFEICDADDCLLAAGSWSSGK